MSECSPTGFGVTGSCPPGCGVSESSLCVTDGSESSPQGLDVSESSPHECGGGGNSLPRGLVVRRARTRGIWRFGQLSSSCGDSESHPGGVAYTRAPTGALRVGEPPTPTTHTHTRPRGFGVPRGVGWGQHTAPWWCGVPESPHPTTSRALAVRIAAPELAVQRAIPGVVAIRDCSRTWRVG